MSGKREEHIKWDSYFLGLAAVASFRSKDPSTQNGVFVVDPNTLGTLVSGYNGFPRGCSDDEFPWARKAENKEDTKYPYVEHAERNAIYFAARKSIALEGSTMYVYSEKGYYPCDECARAIIQSGIRRVVMGWAMEEGTEVYSWDATKRMFKASGMEVVVIKNLAPERVKIMAEDFALIIRKMVHIGEQLQVKENKEEN